MSKLTEFTNVVLHNHTVSFLAESKGISLEESREQISRMSFLEYHRLQEAVGANITPPSGNTISPSSSAQKAPSTSSPAPKAPPSWTGKGPVQPGMSVGTAGPNNTSVPMSVSRVDTSTNGVVVKDPVTGKEQTMNMDQILPLTTDLAQNQQTSEDKTLSRLRELAGIGEMCSGGASGAGAVAIAATPMGNVKKRQPTDEKLKKEYTRTAPAKTIVGDTKPNQASGELSANLAASGKHTANRLKR
jgi:hypothetical protein